MAVTKKRKAADDKHGAPSEWTKEKDFTVKVFLYGANTESVHLKQGHRFKSFQKSDR